MPPHLNDDEIAELIAIAKEEYGLTFTRTEAIAQWNQIFYRLAEITARVRAGTIRPKRFERPDAPPLRVVDVRRPEQKEP